tara:strand:+ start:5117 stop:5728 length:612 start_codon:yes stop_codon:yes gene_type:complete
MSFLKLSDEQQINNINTEKKTIATNGFNSTESMLMIEPVSKPVDTLSFDHSKNMEQKEICSKLKQEQPSLFTQNAVIVKEIANEKQYKQMSQFKSNATVESLIDIMKESNLVLRCNFIRPGFNARNSCVQCTVENLQTMLKAPENDFKIKTVKLNVSNDNQFSPKHGTMFLSSVQDRNSGHHKLYSLDYHINIESDKKLYSLH